LNPPESALYDHQQNIPGFILVVGMITALFSIKIIQDLLEQTRKLSKLITNSSSNA